MQEPKAHYNLISAEITWREQGKEEYSVQRINGVLVDAGMDIPVRLVGKAQQIVQLQFHQRMQRDDVEVLDVVIINFMYLGHFTQAEFHQPPEGTKLQEKAAPVADLDTTAAQAGVQVSDEPAANEDASPTAT